MGRPLIWNDKKIKELEKYLHESNKRLAERFDTTVNHIKKVKSLNGFTKQYK